MFTFDGSRQVFIEHGALIDGDVPDRFVRDDLNQDIPGVPADVKVNQFQTRRTKNLHGQGFDLRAKQTHVHYFHDDMISPTVSLSTSLFDPVRRCLISTWPWAKERLPMVMRRGMP